jgi:Neocarzinostatin family
MAVMRIAFGVLAVVALVAGCGTTDLSAPPSGSGLVVPSDAAQRGPLSPSQAPSAEPLVAALSVTDPQVSVSPSDNLSDGQSVVVRVSGFGIGSKVWISECATSASANDLGCGAELAAQTFTATNNLRSGFAPFTVHSLAAAGPLNTGAIEACSDQCVIVATLGAGYAFAVAKISFEGP